MSLTLLSFKLYSMLFSMLSSLLLLGGGLETTPPVISRTLSRGDSLGFSSRKLTSSDSDSEDAIDTSESDKWGCVTTSANCETLGLIDTLALLAEEVIGVLVNGRSEISNLGLFARTFANVEAFS